MLQVFDQNGVDLFLNPMLVMERQIVAGLTDIPVYAVVQDLGRVKASLDWNDGTQPVVFPEQDSPLVIQVTRKLGFGTYNVTLTAFNTKVPEPDRVVVVFPWQITQLNGPTPSEKVLFGPILPKDDGLPNAQTWNFDRGTDVEVLVSSLKMLLLTSKGERIMQPAYGTSVRRIVFALNVASVETILHQEIAQAVALWEPRVTLQSIKVERDANGRTATVQAAFLSRQSGQVFETILPLTA